MNAGWTAPRIRQQVFLKHRQFFSSMLDFTSQEIQKFLLFLVFKENNENVLLNFIRIFLSFIINNQEAGLQKQQYTKQQRMYVINFNYLFYTRNSETRFSESKMNPIPTKAIVLIQNVHVIRNVGQFSLKLKSVKVIYEYTKSIMYDQINHLCVILNAVTSLGTINTLNYKKLF